MTAFVLDNSVTMRWCFEAGQHPRADAILASLGAPGNSAIVPVLWRYEVSAVLARAENAGTLTRKRASEFFSLLDALPIAIDGRSSERMLAVHQLAIQHKLTSYDAAYLELAMREALPLATFDADLIRACASTGVQVL